MISVCNRNVDVEPQQTAQPTAAYPSGSFVVARKRVASELHVPIHADGVHRPREHLTISRAAAGKSLRK
jgi:hypothetical protein